MVQVLDLISLLSQASGHILFIASIISLIVQVPFIFFSNSLIINNDGKDTVEVHLRTELNFISAPFARYKPNVGGIIHVAIDLQFVVGRIEKNEDEKIVIKWESPLMIRKHGTPRLLICQLDTKPRIIGYAIDYKKLE